MYYTSEDIEQELKCPICKERFDVPKCLPCAQKICYSCEVKLKIVENDKFQCPICENLHDKPLNGLPVDSLAQRFLNMKPKNIYRGEVYKNGMKTVDGLCKVIDCLDEKLDNSEIIIRNHCDLVRNDVDLVTESQICLLNKYRDELINEYEKECLANVKETSKEFKEFKEFVQESSNKYKKWIEYFKCSDIDDSVIKDITNEAETLKELITKKSEMLHDFVFLNNKINLIEEKNEITKKHIGLLTCSVSLKLKKAFAQDPIIFDYSDFVENGLSFLCAPFSKRTFILISYTDNNSRCIKPEYKILVLNNKQLHLNEDFYTSIEHIKMLRCKNITNRFITFCIFNKYILIGSYDDSEECYKIKVLDETLTLLTELHVQYEIKSIQSCKDEFYVVTTTAPLIRIYNDYFELKRSIGPKHDKNKPFNVKDIKLRIKEDFIYCILDKHVFKLCKKSGQIIQNINIDMTNIKHFEVLSDELFLIINEKSELCIRSTDGNPDDVLFRKVKCVSSMMLVNNSTLVFNYKNLRKVHIYSLV